MLLIWLNEDLSEYAALTNLMQSVSEEAERAEGVCGGCSVGVLLCDDETIHQYNRQYRDVDRSTDVLSFPTVSYPAGKTAGACEKLIHQEYDDETGAYHLGDLIVSVPHIYQQAKEYGHTPEREAAFLFAHGLCHLMGYDHIEKKDEIRMRAMEEKILDGLGLTRKSQMTEPDQELMTAAREAMKYSYSPYSHYPVGAAVRCEDGMVYTGCNIENAAYGLTNCAERTAIFKAVSEGKRHFTDIAIASTASAPWPCGACRQVMNEFAPDIRVFVTWGDGLWEESSLHELLPHGFGPNDLKS